MMLKFVAIAAALIVFSGAPTPSNAGMLPGREHDEKLFYYYIYEKAAASCYGDEYFTAAQVELRTVLEQCIVEEWAHSQTITEKISEKEKRSVDASGAAKDGENGAVTDEALTEKMMMKTPFFPADIIRPLKDEVFKSVRLISCLFDYYNLTVTSNGTVDGSSYTTYFKEDTTLPEELKNYILEGINTCEVKSETGSFMTLGSKYINFMKILKFYRCVEEEKMAACMKVDLNKDADDYDLSGLDDELTGVSDLAKRFFIKSSYASWDHTGLWDM